MTPREELEALRRLAELEAKVGGAQPSGVSPEASRMAAEGMSIPETLLVSAGRGTDKIVSGAKQLFAGPERKAALQAEQRENDQAYAGLQEKRPVATSIGEMLPYVAVPASAGVVGAAGAVGALEAAKPGTWRERLAQGLMGAGTTAAGGLVGKAVGGAIAPVSDTVTQSQAAALRTARELGIRPRLSEVTGNRYAAALEDFAARTPGGSGVMKEFAAGNQRAVNTAASRSIGENASELTPEVLSNASGRLGQVFEDIKALPGRNIAINQNVGAVADDILRQQSKMIASQQDANLTQLARQAKALAANNGRIDGETYQLVRSGLSEASYDASGTNKALYGKLLKAVDDSAEQSLRATGNEALAESLKTVRPQYANLKILEKGAVAEGGQVSPARIASALRTQNPRAFREGAMEGNPLYDIARVGENLKPLQAGSPTYERGVTSSLLDTAIKAPFAYAAAKATTSPLALAYPTYVGGTAGARIAAELANPTTRALAAALLQRSLPAAAPIATENY